MLDELILAIWWEYMNEKGRAISKLCGKIITDLFINNQSIATPENLIHFNHNLGFLGFKLIRIDDSTVDCKYI